VTAPERYRVLLVEDNELDARTMSRALWINGQCSVDRVADLTDGLEAVRRDAYDCVLLDLSLPDSDGLVSVETMVTHSPHCPVVVLTGLDDPTVAVEAVGRGAQDYLIKNSITPELVLRSIRYAVARHSAETELLDVKQRLRTMDAREQIARDLHDTVIQRLFAAGMTLQAATRLDSREAIAERAMVVVDDIDVAIRELREAIHGLHSVSPDEAFAIEVEKLAASFEASLGFELGVRLGAMPTLPDELRVDMLAVLREALSNVARHAEATTATLTVAVDDSVVVMRVVDNGRGPGVADTDQPAGDLAAPGRTGNGVRNMRRRAEAHGGALVITTPPGGGCELSWSVPLPAGEPARKTTEAS